MAVKYVLPVYAAYRGETTERISITFRMTSKPPPMGEKAGRAHKGLPARERLLGILAGTGLW